MERESEEIKRKWREYEEIERKWSAGQNEREKEFHLCISISLLQNIKMSHFLSQNIEICHFLSQNVKIRHLLSRMSQKSYEEMILDQMRLRGSPASCASLHSTHFNST